VASVAFVCDEYQAFATTGENEPSCDEKFFSLAPPGALFCLHGRRRATATLSHAEDGPVASTGRRDFRTKEVLRIRSDAAVTNCYEARWVLGPWVLDIVRRRYRHRRAGPLSARGHQLGRSPDERLAPTQERTGVLNRVKVALATLAANATLSRFPRAHVGNYRSEQERASLQIRERVHRRARVGVSMFDACASRVRKS
jgi:hypothetical protein